MCSWVESRWTRHVSWRLPDCRALISGPQPEEEGVAAITDVHDDTLRNEKRHDPQGRRESVSADTREHRRHETTRHSSLPVHLMTRRQSFSPVLHYSPLIPAAMSLASSCPGVVTRPEVSDECSSRGTLLPEEWSSDPMLHDACSGRTNRGRRFVSKRSNWRHSTEPNQGSTRRSFGSNRR